MILLDEATIASGMLIPGIELQRDPRKVAVSFEAPFEALSSAVLNGGAQIADGFLNLRVQGDSIPHDEPPESLISRVANQTLAARSVVGMMTAASMQSLRVAVDTIDNVGIAVLLTSGIENARRAGDTAEWRSLFDEPKSLGTINTAVIITAPLARQAQVEVLTIATEAKVATMYSQGILSPVSGHLATGTGTDATAVFSATGGAQVRYAGKHTILGERVARLVMLALEASLNRVKGGTE